LCARDINNPCIILHIRAVRCRAKRSCHCDLVKKAVVVSILRGLINMCRKRGAISILGHIQNFVGTLDAVPHGEYS
jgi:hypothetical protein